MNVRVSWPRSASTRRQWHVVDDAVVLGALDRLGEFDAFVTQVSGWLLGR